MKNLTVVLLTILIFLGGFLLKVILFPVNTINKSVDMGYQIVDKTLDGDNAIYNYEWFKQQEADIRKCMQNETIAQEEYNTYISNIPKDSKEWSKFQEQEESSLRNSLSALKKLTNKTMEDYNAKASMVNRSIFKDNLPSNITRAFYTGQELTK